MSDLLGAFFGGGRASGGPVGPGQFYQVNESGMEMLTVGGKDYLLTGNKSGSITPAGGFGGVTFQNTYINPQLSDARSESQRQQREAEQLRSVQARF